MNVRPITLSLCLPILMASTATAASPDAKQPVLHKNVILAIHGGAGVIARDKLPKEVEQAVRKDLRDALEVGYRILKQPNGKGLDAVEAAIRLLEDSPVFNAGRGAAFTREKTVELDAAMMCGKTLRAGAVASVTTIKNPISGARAVMERSGHVLLVGRGAEEFAKDIGLEIVDPTWFHTPNRLRAVEEKLRKAKEPGATDPFPTDPSQCDAGRAPDHRFGTVGAVAVDAQGNLAAGTSTGGLTMKRAGRVGDSPIIGAGTYADNRTCAVSATGDGEYFIRATCARTIAALIEYKEQSVAEAAHEALFNRIKPLGGEGGVIVLNAKGEASLPFTTLGMYRGYVTSDGHFHVAVYDDE